MIYGQKALTITEQRLLERFVQYDARKLMSATQTILTEFRDNIFIEDVFAIIVEDVLNVLSLTEWNNTTYEKIISKYKNTGIKIPVDKTEFKKYFQGVPKIHYLIGYLKGYYESSRSTYAKYLTVETIKKLLDKGFNCTLLLIGK